MRNLFRNVLPVLLALCLILSAFPAVAFAAEKAPAASRVLTDELPIVPPDNGETSYRVEYYQQNTEGDGYTLAETVELTAKAGATVEAEDKDYPGFTMNTEKSELSGTVAANGSTVLKLYYDRMLFTVTWKIGSDETKETYRYLATPAFKGSTDRSDGEHGRNFVFRGWDKELAPVTKDVTYTALYDVDCEAFILKDDSWATLQLALEHAKSGDTVRIEKDLTISGDLTVPAGVTLLLPCMDNDKGYIKRGEFLMNPDGTDTGGQGVGPNAKLYRTVTLANGATLTVYGSVMVNAVTGRKATANSDQDVTGGYAVLELNGKVNVEDGGHLDAFGYVRGSGVVTAKNGGTVGDLYIVRHWRGGTHALNMYNVNVYPMNEYDCHNIEATLRIEYGGSLEGIVKMYAAGSYNRTRFPQVDNENGLIRLTDPSSVLVRTYSDGREHFEISGGADFSNSTLKILGYPLTTADYLYPIDGDIDFTLNAGRYNIKNDFKFLPGVIVQVSGGASLTVEKGSTAVFYREFDNGEFNQTSRYPARDPAQLRIAAGASFTNKGTFAGNIYTESADILIGGTPVWETVTYEAKCLTGSTPPEEYTIALEHKLSITRPQYKWRFGEDNSIVWYGGPADYSAVEAAIAKIPADLSIYTDESVQALNDAVAAVVEGLTEEDQAQVDAWAKAINDALAALVPKEGKPADYSAVTAALALVPADLSDYTDTSRAVLENAVNAVQYGLLEEDQAQVDAWAEAILAAINGLSKECDGGENCPSRNFKDVNKGDWYHLAVDFAVERGLFKGMTETTFEPNTAMTRGMLVTVLWRYENSPKEGKNEFVDVKAGDWYEEAVAWAAEHGIVTGVGNGKFDPNGKITREQMAAILYRYSEYKEFDTSAKGDFGPFPDKEKVSTWAKDAYTWAVGAGLITGNVINGRTLLDPQGNATRAQVATILMRFIKAFGK